MTYILRIGQDKPADRAFLPSALGAIAPQGSCPGPVPSSGDKLLSGLLKNSELIPSPNPESRPSRKSCLGCASDFRFLSFLTSSRMYPLTAPYPEGTWASTKERRLTAIEQAYRKEGTRPLWFHSDKGSELNGGMIADWLTGRGTSISMSPKSYMPI